MRQRPTSLPGGQCTAIPVDATPNGNGQSTNGNEVSCPTDPLTAHGGHILDEGYAQRKIAAPGGERPRRCRQLSDGEIAARHRTARSTRYSPSGMLALAFQARSGRSGSTSVADRAAQAIAAITPPISSLLGCFLSRRRAWPQAASAGSGRSSMIARHGMSVRPSFDIVDMIIPDVAMQAAFRPPPLGAQPAHRAGGEPQMEGGLFCGQKRTGRARTRGTFGGIGHGGSRR